MMTPPLNFSVSSIFARSVAFSSISGGPPYPRSSQIAAFIITGGKEPCHSLDRPRRLAAPKGGDRFDHRVRGIQGPRVDRSDRPHPPEGVGEKGRGRPVELLEFDGALKDGAPASPFERDHGGA